MVVFRLMQGVFGAALGAAVAGSDARCLHAAGTRQGDVDLGYGVMMGPIMGPSLGAWLTETYSWHWVFLVNLPSAFHCARPPHLHGTKRRRTSACASTGSALPALAIGIGALQLALDRGEQLGWTESNEIIAEFIIAGVGFYYFLAHIADDRKPFIQFALFRDKNFVGGCVFMAVMGLVLFSTMALASPSCRT
jgi:DHA2 family multidrug resistance protein